MKKYNRKHVYDKEGALLPLKERTFKTNEGYTLEIIDGGSKSRYITCKIEEYVFETQVNNIKKGEVKYHFHPSVYGKGYLGIGKHKATKNGKSTKVYNLWGGMLERAYGINYHKKRPTYKDVEVCKGWLNFQNFATWFYEEANYQEGWALDKDLLSGAKKIYSPETCTFIPQALNLFLTNDKLSNTAGCIGVCWNKRDKKWVAQITDIKTGKQKHIGLYTNIEDAANAYKNEREKYAQIWKDRMKGLLPDNAIKAIA